MSAQEAIEAPRIFTMGEDLDLEPGYDLAIHSELKRRGHHINEAKVIGGGMGMIMFEEQDMTGASCWRADGVPIGIAGGMARQGIRFEV